MNSKLKDAGMDELFRGILSLQSLEECYNFFEDLCTITELRAMEQRFEVARMLDEGRIYSDIVRETGASTATISRVNKCLTYGTDGYRNVLDRLKADVKIANRFLSVYYDRFTGDVGYPEWADYCVRRFREAGITPEIVLDLACGTGRLCAELAVRGYDMIGVDAPRKC